MGARQKLNSSHFAGSVGLAALVGWLGQSWAAFALALMVLFALNVATGEIRPARRRGR